MEALALRPEAPMPAPDQAASIGGWIATAEQLLDQFQAELLNAALALPHLDRVLLDATANSLPSAPRILALSAVAGSMVILVYALSTFWLRDRRERAARERVPFVAVLKLTGWSLVPLLLAMAVGRLVSVQFLGRDPSGAGFPREFVVAVVHWLAAITFLGMVFRPRIPQLRLISLDEAGAQKGLRQGAMILAAGHFQACLLAAAGRAGMPPSSVKLLAVLTALGLAFLVFRLLHLLRRHGLKPVLHISAGWLIVVVTALWIWGWTMRHFELYQGIKSTTIALLLAIAFDRAIALSIHLSRRPGMMRRLFVLRVVFGALATAIILRVIIEYWLVGTFALIDEQDWPVFSRRINFALLVLFCAVVLAAITHAWIESRMMPREALGSLEDEELRQARVSTVLPIIRLALLGLIGSVFSLVALSALGVDTTPVVAGAGILGLAVSLGSQALVKDVISGIFWMLDDAFRLGEEIEIDGTHGRVEQIQIRSLRLRAHDGRLHTIPFGQIETVASRSRGLVQARVSVALEEPPNAVRQDRLLRLAASALRSEAALKAAIVGKIAISPASLVSDGRDLVLTFHLAKAAAAGAVPLIRALLLEVLEASGFDLAADGVHVSLGDMRAAAADERLSAAEASTP